MEIVYQKNKDKQPVYDMYQEIFEDPEPFAQYYFEEIYATNQVILAEEDNKILGMIHLNPYHIRAGKKTYTLNYGEYQIKKWRGNANIGLWRLPSVTFGMRAMRERCHQHWLPHDRHGPSLQQ